MCTFTFDNFSRKVDQYDVDVWVCPLGNAYPSAVWTLCDLIPSIPIGLGTFINIFIKKLDSMETSVIIDNLLPRSLFIVQYIIAVIRMYIISSPKNDMKLNIWSKIGR